jgi:hypothetical protein
MKPLMLFAVLASVLSGPAGAKPVYKCEENGKITYTDQPCSPDARTATMPGLIVVEPPPSSQRDLARAWDQRIARERTERDRADGEWLKQHANRKDREQRVRKAILAHKVIKSMTFDEVKQALGEPDHVDSGDSYGTDKQTWIYLADGDRRTVNFKNGEVTTTTRKGRRGR